MTVCQTGKSSQDVRVNQKGNKDDERKTWIADENIENVQDEYTLW